MNENITFDSSSIKMVWNSLQKQIKYKKLCPDGKFTI